jgi:SAM-dependent methyltransferase
MDVLPDDAAARQELLERWVAEQAERRRMSQPPPRLPLRTRLRLTVRRLRSNVTVARWPTQRVQRLTDLVLDRGLDTSAFATEPEHDHPDRLHYRPSPWHVLPRALHYLGVSDRDTFVDFGCGKGRVVHQAARWPFRRVIGVEISPILAEVARTSLAARRHQHRCRDVEIIVADAAEFRVPDDLTVAYFFRPFTNETLDSVLRGIVDSIDRRPRCVRLIYVCPQDSPQVLATERFRLLREQRSKLLDGPEHRAAIYESL